MVCLVSGRVRGRRKDIASRRGGAFPPGKGGGERKGLKSVPGEGGRSSWPSLSSCLEQLLGVANHLSLIKTSRKMGCVPPEGASIRIDL